MTELTQEQRIARHKDFLKANWHLIAAFSWENYLTKGRGVVMVPEEDFVHATVPQLKGLRFHYLALTDKNPDFAHVLADKESRWLESYDPDEKVIICIVRPEGVSSYLFGGPAKNSQAYAQQKAATTN